MGQKWDVTSNEYFDNFCAFRTQAILAGKKVVVEIQTGIGSRTPTQNNCIHEYCGRIAIALNDAGLDRVITSPVLAEPLSVPWCKLTVKSDIWHRVQMAMTGIESSRDLSTVQVSEIYETIHRHLATAFGLQVEWPTRFNG
jgi:hypothetical protein